MGPAYNSCPSVSISCSTLCLGSLPGVRGFQAAGNSFRREATSGVSLHTEATEESVGENLVVQEVQRRDFEELRRRGPVSAAEER